MVADTFRRRSLRASFLDNLPIWRDAPQMFTTLMFVGCGGALGAMSRYLTGVGVMRIVGPGFPFGTMAVNVLGSFLMGALIVTLAHYSANRFAPLLATGFLGGFTTFSAFSLDAVVLYERGAHMLAASYVLSSVILSVLALFLGLAMARMVLT